MPSDDMLLTIIGVVIAVEFVGAVWAVIEGRRLMKEGDRILAQWRADEARRAAAREADRVARQVAIVTQRLTESATPGHTGFWSDAPPSWVNFPRRAP